MRERWTRTTPVLALEREEAEALIRPALPDARVLRLEPLGGGHSNTNIRAVLDDGSVVLRLYQRDPGQAAKEAALATLVAGKVPAPRYLHVGARETNGQTYAVVEWVDGVPLALAAKRADDEALDAMGGSVGAVLAAIHAFTFDGPGMLDGALKITPFPAGLMLSGYFRHCFEGLAGARLGKALADAVVDFAARNEGRLEAWSHPARLVHFDFGASNILMARGEPTRVAGVVDWEFAASAAPSADFGNLLRPPLGQRDAFVAGLERGYRAAGGFLPGDWRELTRIADLGAWVEFLTRPNVGDAVIEDARRALQDAVGF